MGEQKALIASFRIDTGFAYNKIPNGSLTMSHFIQVTWKTFPQLK